MVFYLKWEFGREAIRLYAWLPLVCVVKMLSRVWRVHLLRWGPGSVRASIFDKDGNA